MSKEIYGIKTNIAIGEQIFNAVPKALSPFWAGLILAKFDTYFNIPDAIKCLYPIIDEPSRWKEAHGQFTQIRRFSLNNKNYKPEAYLLLAEKVAKVTYNASGELAPFDYDSGYYIPSLAFQTAEYVDDKRLEEDLKSTLLLFNRNKKLQRDLTSARELIEYQKIDEILWYEWDPIGINDNAPRDEYQSYVPQIFDLFKSNANKQTIAETLSKIETDDMGLVGNMQNCINIADKICLTKKLNVT